MYRNDGFMLTNATSTKRPHRILVTPRGRRMDSSDLNRMVSWAHPSQPPNGISIGSAFSSRAHERDQQTDTHTDRQTTLLHL